MSTVSLPHRALLWLFPVALVGAAALGGPAGAWPWDASSSSTAKPQKGYWAVFYNQTQPAPTETLNCDKVYDNATGRTFDMSLLELKGDQVTLIHEANSGSQMRHPCDQWYQHWRETTTGKLDHGKLVLKGAVVTTVTDGGCAKGPAPTATDSAVVYDLRFHPETGRLVGTRNGKPFWATFDTCK